MVVFNISLGDYEKQVLLELDTLTRSQVREMRSKDPSFIALTRIISDSYDCAESLADCVTKIYFVYQLHSPRVCVLESVAILSNN